MTEQKTKEAVNNTEVALVLVLQHQAQAHLKQTGIVKGATHCKNFRASARSQTQFFEATSNSKFPVSSHSICGISLVVFKNRTSPIPVHMKLFSTTRRVNSNTVLQLTVR